ncbi:MAG: threonine/serine exporter family protein [Ruminococcaceae bacterium]|nr:threonine/serine exporter family protein [Oscillospiraceae bacterium]
MNFLKRCCGEIMINYEELINTATDVGYMLLSNGAEIYRVEESMQRIFRAYSVDGEIFAIPTCIFVTIHTEDDRPVTKIRRCYSRTTNLDKVDRVNDLCRRICRDTPDFKTIRRELRGIDARPNYTGTQQVLAFSMVAFAFTLFYGGTFADAFVAVFCGAAIKIVSEQMERFHANSFFVNILASAVSAAIALTAAHYNVYLNPDKIIIGALMNMVPGIAITSFMRDLMAGDLVAGLIRLTESLLVAAAIAIGSGLVLTATRLLWGV